MQIRMTALVESLDKAFKDEQTAHSEFMAAQNRKALAENKLIKGAIAAGIEADEVFTVGRRRFEYRKNSSLRAGYFLVEHKGDRDVTEQIVTLPG